MGGGGEGGGGGQEGNWELFPEVWDVGEVGDIWIGMKTDIWVGMKTYPQFGKSLAISGAWNLRISCS